MILRALSSRSRWFRSTGFRHDLTGLGLIAVCSLGGGLVVNGLRQHPLPLIYAPPGDRLDAVVAQLSPPAAVSNPSALAPRQPQSIGLDSFQEFVSEHQGISIDARPSAIYEAGHVPGALNLPREDFASAYAKVRALIEQGKERPIVVYCSESDCKDSELVAGALSRLGYRHLLVFKEGWEEWLRAGLPQEQGPPS